MMPQEIALIVYAAIGLVAAGVVLEIEGSDALGDALPWIIAWPLCLAAAVVVAGCWCAMWIVRGPVRLAIWTLERRARRAAELPRAQVRQ